MAIKYDKAKLLAINEGIMLSCRESAAKLFPEVPTESPEFRAIAMELFKKTALGAHDALITCGGGKILEPPKPAQSPGGTNKERIRNG